MKPAEIFNPYYLKKACFYILRRPYKLKSLWRVFFEFTKNKYVYFDKNDYFAGPPFFVIVRCTNRCNLRCSMCGQWGENGVFRHLADEKHITEEMDTETWKKFIAGIAQFRPYLAFFGGEPFIRKDLMELVRFASNLGLLVWIGTNGTLLESQAEEIVLSGADYIYVSLDGPKQVNDAIRKGENVFERVTAGIRALVKAKKRLGSELPLIQIDMTIIRENHTRIFETSQIAAELGADSFTVRYPIFTSNHLEKISSDIFTKEFGKKPSFFKGFVRDFSGIDIAEIERQVAMVRKIWKSRFRPIPGGKNFSPDVHFNSPHLPHGNRRCFIPWVRAQVMPNGNVVLCEDYPEIVAGNIRKQEFLDIWNNDEYRHFRQFIKENGILPVCNRCCGLYEVE